MKFLFLAFTLTLSTSVFAQKFKTCTPEQFQILDRAQGEHASLVDQVIHLEAANFSCKVKVNDNLVFPADCNRFIYTELEYKISVGGVKLSALVKDGHVSCTNITATNVFNVVIAE